MSEMIERVARAIQDAMDITDGLDATAAATYARAAIEAMRMPTAAMVDASQDTEGGKMINTGGGSGIWMAEDARKWQAMIDAALNEKADA